MKIGVFGCGAWGIAITSLLQGNGHDVTLCTLTENLSEMLNKTRENPHLPGIIIPADVIITPDIDTAANGAEIAVVATASFELRDTAAKMNNLPDGAVAVCMSKGIGADDGKRFSEILREELHAGVRVAVLSGPSHAEEVARCVPTACVAASTDRGAAELVQDAFMNENFRVYTSGDVVGVELGAALKNVIALCAGICDGLGFGDNTIAMLATRGLAEIAALVTACGGMRETMAGLAGLGDLIVTCTSQHSRNRRAGVLIGRGMTVQDAMNEVGAAVEGYYAAKAARVLAERADVDMPICAEAYRVLYEGKEPRAGLRDLMNRAKKSEVEGFWVNE